jgi:hypothetical protein
MAKAGVAKRFTPLNQTFLCSPNKKPRLMVLVHITDICKEVIGSAAGCYAVLTCTE